MRYIFRPSLPLKYLSYREATGQVTYSPPGGVAKIWPHANDFLADWAQHIPRAKQHQVTYAGWFANALGKLNPTREKAESSTPATAKPKWVRWRHPIRPRSPPPPDLHQEIAQDSQFFDEQSQVPPAWEEWDAA